VPTPAFNPNWTASVTAFAGLNYYPLAGAPGDKGWVRLHFSDNGSGVPTDITAIDWAFQFDPDKTIKAGQTSDTIPEPATLSLLALGAVGIGAMRRRRKTPARAGQAA
jgi:PEP-CTERM motif